MLKAIGFGMLGIVAWLFSQAIALGLGGAGHGWISPFWASLSLIALYPIVFIRAFASRSISIAMQVGILVAAIMLDLFLIESAMGSEHGYFLKVWEQDPGRTSLWIASWAGWQFLALEPLLSRRNLHPASTCVEAP